MPARSREGLSLLVMPGPAQPTTRSARIAQSLRLNRQLLLGGLLFLLGAGLTIVLAFLAGAKEPPSQATQALMVLLAILAQGGAARVFYGRGKADPSHAKRSTARLISLARRASQAEAIAQRLFEEKLPVGDLRQGLGILSTDLSWLQEGIIEAYEDWRIFHPDVTIAELEADDVNKPD